MKVLVTGGSGFLGYALSKRLIALGHTVTYLSRSENTQLTQLNAQWVKGDIADPSIVAHALEKKEAVFHTAALAGYWGRRIDYYRTNVIGTSNVIDGCLKKEVPNLIYTSSPSVIFDGTNLERVNERYPYPERHLCFYSETKAIAERMVLEKNKLRGLKTISLRPHLIWGPGDHHLLPRILERAKMKKLKIVGDGKNKVDIIYIDNAVEGHILAWEALKAGKACDGKSYFIADESPVELWVWINQLLQKMELPEVKIKVPYRTAYRIGAILEWVYKTLAIQKEPPMTRFVADSLATHHYFDQTNAKTDLQYHPIVSPEEAFHRTLQEFKKR